MAVWLCKSTCNFTDQLLFVSPFQFRSRMSSSPENLTLSITFERSGQMYELDNPMELNGE